MIPVHRARRLSGRAVLVLIVLAATALPARAIPAFARKYQTSCQTCHIAFPKLNPFGEAFRLRGYRMPGETEEMIKEKPISLGAPAYKRVWPEAVWPSDMPGTIPVSLNTIFNDITERPNEAPRVTTKNAFNFPEEVSILSGGTLGETLSFFGEVTFEPEVEDGKSTVNVDIEHSQLNFNGPFGTGTAFNLKVGRMMAEITQPFAHSALLTTEGPANILMFNPIGLGGGSDVGGMGGGIAIPHGVDGLEAYGILRHRFLYSGGISNGIGPGADSPDGNAAKDVFARVAYKLGGLPFDGEGYTPSDKNWRERSLRAAFFVYRGNGNGVFFPAMGADPADMAGMDGTGASNRVIEDRTFTRVGFDLNAYYQDLNVIFGFVRGRDTLAVFSVDGDARTFREQGDFTYRTWFVEGDYVIYPWLHGAVRYEWLDPANKSAPTVKQIVPNLTALVRANVKAFLELQRRLGASDAYELQGGLRFVF